MSRISVARDDIKHFKTLGLLGDIFHVSMEMKHKGIPFLPLHLGDPPQFDFKPIPSFIEGIKKALEKPISYAYGNPRGYLPLIEKIAEIEHADPHYIFLGNGLSDLMDKLFNALAITGTNVLLPAPVFAPYIDINIKNKIETRLYKCDVDTWQPEVDSILENIDDHTSIILINSPNNPTGAVYHESIITEIIDVAEGINRSRMKRDIAPLTLLFDEIYKELYYDEKPADIENLIKDKHITYVIFNGASKAFNATGLRVGYAIVGGLQRDEIRQVLYNEVMLPLCMNSVFQEGYLAALSDPDKDKYFKENVAKLRKRRDLMYNKLSAIPGIKVVKPQGAFYMIVKMETEFNNDLDLGLELLREERICTSQMSAFFDAETQPEGTFLRLVFLPPTDIIEDAMERIKNFMDRHRK